jgi:hypothetical protein
MQQKAVGVRNGCQVLVNSSSKRAESRSHGASRVEDAKDVMGRARARAGGASSLETVETIAHAQTNAAQKERGTGFAMSKYPSGVSPFHTPTGTPEGSFSKERVAGGSLALLVQPNELTHWYKRPNTDT